MTTSWDCFDTLVARRGCDPLSVFDAMGKKYSLDNFTAKRKNAEYQAPHTLHTIYEALAPMYRWTPEQKEFFKQAEIQEEIDHCIPIVENLRQVKDGDLIVSDMYLPSETVEAILRKNGLTKAVSIYVTTGGKSSGTIWNTLPPIELHVGDNWHSDVESPKQHGINAKHYSGHGFSETEEQIGGELSLLMRAVRLANPYEYGSNCWHIWREQSQLNIPALILAASDIPKANVAFIYRDCIHLHRIHEQLHGSQNNAFHCSRVALKLGGEQWDQYVKQRAYGRTIVDLQGSGNSISEYWLNTFNEEPDLLYVAGVLRIGKALVNNKLDAIERFNSCDFGSLAKFPERYCCEFTEEILRAQHGAINCCIEHMRHLQIQSRSDTILLEKIAIAMTHSHTFKINCHVTVHN